MRVLVGCEYSAIVREAFRKRGHYALSCDLDDTDIPGNHYKGDIFDVLDEGWDLAIFFPPCTYLTTTANRHFLNNPDRWEKRLEAAKFAHSLFNCSIPRIAMENPKGVLSTYIGKPDQIIHPYYFGSSIPKTTCLWLKNLPPLRWSDVNTLFEKKTSVEPEYLEYNSKRTKSGKSRYSVFGKLGSGHGKERSKFFPEVAEAMADQWGKLEILNEAKAS